MISSKWSATCPIDLPANTSGWALASSTVSGSAQASTPRSRCPRTPPPNAPSCWQQPQTVNEHHRRAPGGICLFTLLQLVFGDRLSALRSAGRCSGHGGASHGGTVHPDGHTELTDCRRQVWAVEFSLTPAPTYDGARGPGSGPSRQRPGSRFC
jgi:hypothetical protein